MQTVIIDEPGTMLSRTSERLVVRGARPRLELVEGGPQLALPMRCNGRKPNLTVLTSGGERQPAQSPRRLRPSPNGRSKASANTAMPPEVARLSAELAALLSGHSPAAAASADNGSAGRRRHSRLNEIVELPLFRISEIVVAARGVALSSDLLEACCERGIRISFLDRGGKPFAMLSSPNLTATVLTRREQLAAYNDPRGVDFARAIVRGKLGNQAGLLKYFGKYLKRANPEAFTQLTAIIKSLESSRREIAGVIGDKIDDVRQALLTIEGSAGRNYWSAVRLLLGERIEFGAREHRGAGDPVNSALNYGYGILYSQIWGALLNAGLEPFAGFLHVDRPGKPSLVLDLIEEFRQPVVDRAVIAAITRGSLPQTREGMLTDSSRKALAGAVLEQLEAEVGFQGQRHRLKSVIQIQARNLATVLREPAASYRCYSFKW